MAKLLIIYLIGILVFFNTQSQSKEIDSLKSVLPSQSGIEKVQSLNELSWFLKNSNIDSALLLANQALEYSKEIKDPNAESQSLNSLANALEAKGLLDSSRIVHEIALDIKIQLKDTVGMAASMNNLGITHDQLGNFETSLSYYFDALRYYEATGENPFEVAMVLGNIGIVYKKQKEYEKVLEYYLKALEIYEEVSSDFGIMVTLGNIGGVYLQTGDYDSTIFYSTKAKEAYEAAGYTRYVPYMTHNIAVAYDSLGQFSVAEPIFKESIRLHRESDNDYELAATLISYGVALKNARKLPESVKSLEEAHEISLKMDALEFQTNALRELISVYKLSGRFEKATESAELFIGLNDMLYEKEKAKSIFELETQYQTEKKEQQIKIQEAELESQNAIIQRDRIMLGALLLVIVFIITVSLLARSRMKYKQKERIELEKNKAKEAQISAVIFSQEKERNRFSRDLHDTFGQLISILNLNIENLKKEPKKSLEARDRVFQESSKILDDMYKELKNVCFDLMPQSLMKSGLQAAVEEFADRINRTGKISVTVDFFGLEERLEELKEISYYRIIQEWVNNVLKYSDASIITIQFSKDEKEIDLLIEDNGMGFDIDKLLKGDGNGWRNIQSRANLIHASVDIDSVEGRKNTTLIVNTPLDSAGQKIKEAINYS